MWQAQWRLIHVDGRFNEDDQLSQVQIGTSLQKLQQFLSDIDAQYDKLLTHNNVHWLSKGNALIRIWQLREDLLVFLETCGSRAEMFLNMIKSD